MTKEELAIAVINLRRTLKTAQRMLAEYHQLIPACDEQQGPTFREGRAFWAEVRRLMKD